MKPGMRVTVLGRPGVVKALRPGNSVDVQFDGEPFTTRHDGTHVISTRLNPGPRGGLTPNEREGLPTSDFALPGRRFPINDRRHAVIAMQYILRGFVADGDAPTVLKAIHKKYPPTDRRNAEIWAFFEKHRAKLLRPKTASSRRSRVVSAAANPGEDVYDPAKEQFRAVVQGVYESQVRKELGAKHDAPFQSAAGRRLDERLDPETKKRLLSRSYAITTRQGQRYGWLEPGTQTPTGKGRARAEQRLADASGHAEENRQDYERTLASVRKSGHYRVVAEVVKGQKRYVVEPRPPAEMLKIPEYRLSEEKAREDANRAEAAFRSAPKALKARANPFYLTAEFADEVDVEDAPDHIILNDNKQDTLRSAAVRLGVEPRILLRYGILERPDGEGGWDEMVPLSLPRSLGFNVRVGPRDMWSMPGNTPIPAKLSGYRVRKDLLIQHLEGSPEMQHSGKYPSLAVREASVADFKTKDAERRRKLKKEAAARAEEAQRMYSRASARGGEEKPGEVPVALMSTDALKAEMDAIIRMPGWSGYKAAVRNAEMVERTTAGPKGGKLVREGAQNAVNNSYIVIGRGILGVRASEDELMQAGKAVVARGEAIELELDSPLRKKATATSTAIPYDKLDVPFLDQRKMYLNDAELVRRFVEAVPVLEQDVERFTRRGDLAKAFEQGRSRDAGVALGRDVLGKAKAATATEDEAYEAANKLLDRYLESGRTLSFYAAAKARLDATSEDKKKEYEDYQAPKPTEEDRNLAMRRRLAELEAVEEDAFSTVRRLESTPEGRDLQLRRGAGGVFLAAYGKLIVGPRATETEAIRAAEADYEKYAQAKSALEELRVVRQSLDLDTTPAPKRRMPEEMYQQSLVEAAETVAALTPRKAALRAAASALFESLDPVAVSLAARTRHGAALERLGRKILGETRDTPQSSRVSAAAAIQEAEEFLLKYDETQGLLDKLAEAERLLEDSKKPRQTAAAAKQEVPSKLQALLLEWSGDESVKTGLDLKAPGAGNVYEMLLKAKNGGNTEVLQAAMADVAQKAGPSSAETPEVKAANAAAYAEFVRRHINGLIEEVLDRLAPGRVVVVYHIVRSPSNPNKFLMPRAYLAPYSYKKQDGQKKGESFMRNGVWQLLLYKPDAKFGEHIAVYDDYAAAVAAVNERIARQKAAGSPANLKIASLYQEMLDEPEDVFLSLKNQVKNDKRASTPRPAASTSPRLTAREAAREMSLQGSAAQAGQLRRVMSTLEAETAVRTAAAGLLAGKERPTFREQMEAEARAVSMASSEASSRGLALNYAGAISRALQSGALGKVTSLLGDFVSSRGQRQKNLSGGNTLRERLLGPLKPKAMTPKERQARKLPGADTPTRAFYDVEFLFNPRTQRMEARYVLYVPRVLQFISQVEQVLGMTVLAEPEAFVRFKQGAPERGPLASAAPPPDTYQKVTAEITAAREELSEAKSKGGPLTYIRALRKLKGAFAKERRYKSALMGANSPYVTTGTKIIRGADKLALFVDPTGGISDTKKQQQIAEQSKQAEGQMLQEDDYLAQMASLSSEFGEEAGRPMTEAELLQQEVYAKSQEELDALTRDLGEEGFRKKIVTSQEAWLEDKSFRAEIRRSSVYDVSSGRFFTADDRKKYAKYYTTNEALAYYTIMLWNTPELFTGTVVYLPVSIKAPDGSDIDYIQTGSVFDDNPPDPKTGMLDPYKVYNELLEYEVMLRAQLVSSFLRAKTDEDWNNVSRLWIALYGAEGAPGEPRLEGYVEAVAKIAKNLEPLDSAQQVFGLWGYERRRLGAWQRLNSERTALLELLGDENAPENVRERLRQRLEDVQDGISKFNQISENLTFASSPLGDKMRRSTLAALMFGARESEGIETAWRLGDQAVQKAIMSRVNEAREAVAESRNLPQTVRERLITELNTMNELESFFSQLKKTPA
jgi:hypothetical protein